MAWGKPGGMGHATRFTHPTGNGYEPDGPDRELYITFNQKDPSKNVTEIQFPVKEKAE
jgi:hypothetical protein